MGRKLFPFLCLGFLAVAPFLAASHEETENDKHVNVLSNDGFDDFIEAHNHTLVMFYAPWCGHCKNFMPHFAEAAAKMKDNEGVKFAKVDATAETDLGTRFDIKGYPTIKFFKRDGTDVDYTGGRTTDTVISWVEGMTGPALVTMTESEIKSKESSDGIIFVGRVKAEDSKAYKLLSKAAEKRRLTAKFGVIVDNSNKDDITVYRPDEKPVTNPIGTSLEKVEEWIDKEKFPFFGPINGKTYAAYEEKGLDIVWFAGTRDDYTKHRPEIVVAAQKFRDEYSFVWVDNDEFGSYIEGGLGISQVPGLVIRSKQGGRYKFDKKFVSKDIIKFVEDVKAGKVEKFLKSEAIPESNDEPVKVIVGKNFDEMVFQKDKDVMLEVYAPWCGHCKRLEPIYKEFAEKVEQFDHLLIAKMDGTANESPHEEFAIQGFPTLFWVKAGEKKPVTYTGARTLEGLLSHVKENSSKPVDIEVEHEEKEEEEDKDEL